MTDFEAVIRESKSRESVIHYDDIEFIAVFGEDVHAWYEGTHYVEGGIADTVAVGDLFYAHDPLTEVWRVLEIDESVPSSEPGVTFEHLYNDAQSARVRPVATDVVSLDVLLGEYTMSMGDPGPPSKLVEVTESEW